MMKKLFFRIHRKLRHLCLRPIRVFCFHQVSGEFEPETMKEGDWMQTEMFKNTILSLKEKYVFVSLQEAYHHIANDKIRIKQYAVLTADDGWASLKNILPWLFEQKLPITLFLNPHYLDGVHFRGQESEHYLLEDDLKHICENYFNVSIGFHGWEHVDVTKQSESEFREGVERSIQVLKHFTYPVPFFAYTWGKHNEINQRVLEELKLVPVYMDGQKNYDDISGVHRELLLE